MRIDQAGTGRSPARLYGSRLLSDASARIWNVIPTYNVVPEIEIDDRVLLRLNARAVIDGFSIVRDYSPLIDITWDEAEDCVAAEDRWLERAAGAPGPKQFDEILYAAPDEEAHDDFDWLFRSNDVGVAGLVLALSAAGYATYYSCRGHAGIVGTRLPQVRFGTEPDRLRQLAPYVSRAGCGAVVDTDGLVTVYAQSVTEMHRLARLVVDDQAVFAALNPPPWLAEGLEALKALEVDDEFDWGDTVIG
ncbi:hypothetical protein H7H51_20645 [Mycolicibacterium farcinogenes]|nr:hypothetical protein [Mycolicibacterium farcinogenes]